MPGFLWCQGWNSGLCVCHILAQYVHSYFRVSSVQKDGNLKGQCNIVVNHFWVWRNSSMVKNDYWSYRGPRFSSHLSHGDLLLPITSGNPMASSDLWPLHKHKALMYIQAHKNTHKNKSKNNWFGCQNNINTSSGLPTCIWRGSNFECVSESSYLFEKETKMLKNNLSYLLLIEKYHSPLKMNKRWFILETNMSDNDLGTDSGYLECHVQV